MWYDLSSHCRKTKNKKQKKGEFISLVNRELASLVNMN